jgi:hypothetical protein
MELEFLAVLFGKKKGLSEKDTLFCYLVFRLKATGYERKGKGTQKWQ